MIFYNGFNLLVDIIIIIITAIISRHIFYWEGFADALDWDTERRELAEEYAWEQERENE